MTDREDMAISAVAALVAGAGAVAGALFAPSTTARWLFAVNAAMILAWLLVRFVRSRRGRGEVTR